MIKPSRQKAGRFAQEQKPDYLELVTAASIFVEIAWNVVFNLLPRVVAPVMSATEISAAIRPYSIAVAPDSSLTKRAKILVMETLLVCCLLFSTPTTVSVVRLDKTYTEAIAIPLRKRLNKV